MEIDGENQRWRLRYASVLLGQGVSLIGSSLTQFVLLWWITETTGRVSDLALAGLFGLLPQALLGAVGGTAADRYSRRLIMVVSDLISALCMLVLIYLFSTDRVELWHLYTMMFIRSSMQAFQQPAMMATTPLLVPRSFIPRAAGLNQMIAGLMLIAAPALGAIAIATMPIGYALSIDVITAILGVIPLIIFAIPQTRPEHTQRFLGDLVQGVHVVWRNPGLRILYGLMALIVLVITPLFTLIPLLVSEHFKGGPPQVALLQSLSAIGMSLGGLVVVAISPQRKIRWILAGFSLASISVTLTGAPTSNQVVLAAIAWGCSSLFYVIGRTPITALLQLTIDNRLQGRAFSLLTTFEAMAAPIGLLLVAPIGDEIGVRALFIILGTITTAVTLTGFLSKSLRSLDDDSIPIALAPVDAAETIS